MTIPELLRNAATIARRDMHNFAAGAVLDTQADIAERIERCRETGGEHHPHAGYDQLHSMLAPELARPAGERIDFMERLARKIAARDGVVQ